MLKDGIPIGKLFGISIRVHYSWFVILALVVWSLSVQYFPSIYQHWSTAEDILAAVITSLIFFICLLAHELMHSLVAEHYGIPVRNITLFLFGGVSQITEEPRDARTEFRIAIAGPLTSIVLGLLFVLLWFVLPDSLYVVAEISFLLGWINLVLAVFNLIPGFPLDGGRVLRAIIWWRTHDMRRATRWAANIGRGIGYLLIAAGAWMVIEGLTSGNGDLWSGVWIAFIGWFLSTMAAGSYRQATAQQSLTGHTVSEVTRHDCLPVAPELSVERLIDDYIVPAGRGCFAVTQEGAVLGLVTLQEVKGVLRDMRDRTSVAQIMRPLDRLRKVTPAEDLSNVLNIMASDNLMLVPVMQDGQFLGVVRREDLLAFVRLRANAR